MSVRRAASGWIVRCGLVVFFAGPLVAMVVLSLQANEASIVADQQSVRAFVPRSISLQNYRDVFSRPGTTRSLVNSVAITLTTVVAGLAVNSWCAYAFARLRWRGRRAMFGIVVALMIVPFQAVAIPLLLIVNRFDWLDTYQVQIVPFVAKPFHVFLFYLSFAQFSTEIEDAATVDGAGRWTIYWRMIVPLSHPVFATVAVLHGLEMWGSFLWPLMVTRGADVRPVPVAMEVFTGGSPTGDIFAFAVVITLPVLVCFVAFQKAFIRSIASRQLSAG